MIVTVKTETGSTYVLRDDTPAGLTWERVVNPVEQHPDFPLRTQGGPLDGWPSITVGERMALCGPPLNPAATVRLIYTSVVLSFEVD